MQLHQAAHEQQQALNHLEDKLPDFMATFKQIGMIANMPNKLNAKVKALITLSLAIQTQQEDCIIHHVKLAHQQDITLDEVKELIPIAAYMGGGPALMAAEKALCLLEALKKE